ncbi:MAG: FtsW/RodA/SpoVE family cell cycle protein [Phycisphaerae bacterium]
MRLLLIAAALGLAAIGIAAIYAVGHPVEPSPASKAAMFADFWKRQVAFAILAAVAFFAINLINYRKLGEYSFRIYLFVLGLLALLLLGKIIDIPFVPMINGTHRWIRFTIAGRQLPAIQPSELCKVAYVLALAWYLRYRSNYRSFKALIGPFILTLLPMVLILLEPDLGTVMLMMPVLFIMLFVAGARVKHLLLIILMAVLVSPVMWTLMRPYQRARISSVLLQSPAVQQKAVDNPKLARVLLGKNFNPRTWHNETGFHLIRSKYAVASGGASGQGFAQGPFIKYDFLPYRVNDFIFATIAHQWGFWGAVGVISLYIIIILCGIEIGASNTDPFARLLATGIIATLSVEVIANISMTLGLMPITGLTLPFVSYGGSSLLGSALLLGLLNNIGRARPFSIAPPKI